MNDSLQALINKLHFVSAKLHMFHWNVMGRDFLSFHKFFEDAYKNIIEQKDAIAEYARTIGMHPELEFSKIEKLAINFKLPHKAEEMLTIALQDYEELLTTYTSMKEHETLEVIITEFIPQINKNIYFIKSILNLS